MIFLNLILKIFKKIFILSNSLLAKPNPVIDMLTISATKESNSGVVKLHSISGELLYENMLEKNTIIDMSGYSNGIYIPYKIRGMHNRPV